MSMKNITDFYPLSPMQQGMLFHNLAAPQSEMYFGQSSFNLVGNLNIAGLNHAWQQVVNRHAVLRTCVVWEGLKEPVQVVHHQVTVPFLHHDWRHLSSVEQQEQIAAFLQSDRSQGFHLKTAPLIRLALIQLTDNYYHFTWSYHLLLLDGWSVPLIFQEVLAFYEAFSQGKELFLPSSPPYRDYIVWLQQQNLAEAERFWRQLLKGFTVPTKVWVNQNSQQMSNENFVKQERRLQASSTTALRSLAQKHHLTLNTILQGAWALLLSRYSGEEDVIFGTTVSGRPSALPKAESMVGLFINTLPVRVQVDPETFLLPWLEQIQAQQVEARQYEYSPLVEIQGWSEVSRGFPLFESLIVFENYPEKISLQERGIDLEINRIYSFEKSNYPLTMSATPGNELLLEGEGFDSVFIDRILEHLETLLKAIVANPQKQLKDLQMLTVVERHVILKEWNATQTEYPEDKCIHELFSAQVERTPNAIAVVFEDQHLTYRELNNRANQLAHYLQKLGVKPEVLVGIYLERSLLMLVAILGILFAGGAYIPLDPTYPKERLNSMLEDAQVALVLTQQQLSTDLDQHQKILLNLDSIWKTIAQQPTTNCHNQANPENLAYVIYTSGSTGKPKGVAVSHQALVNYALELAKQLDLQTSDRMLQFAAIGFDVVVEELFPTWLSGATVVVQENKQAISGAELLKLSQKEQLTIFELPTAYWHQLVYSLSLAQEKLPACVRLTIIGGEQVSPERLAAWQQFDIPLVHVFGLTETTVTSTLYYLPSDADVSKVCSHLPIGRPIANTQMYLLDSKLQPVPAGVAGEIYIGGVGLARGYLNRASITAERFIPDPFAQVPGARLYRTGDLGRYTSDGNIQFWGRIDHQVKIRGFRIELGEIEALLSGHPLVKETVVIDREDIPGNKSLVAYLVPSESEKLENKQLRSFLKQQLPEYMIPSAFVTLENLPLTPNGKIDRQALPAPDLTQLIPESNFVAFLTPVEEMLIGIWAEILGIKTLSIHDNFFELGGHSLLATQMISQLRQNLSVELALSRLFDSPTIAELALDIDKLMRSGEQLHAPAITPASRDTDLPLSFAQQRLWFLYQLEPDSPAYNVPEALRLQGMLNLSVLDRSIQEIIRRHETLRTTFAIVNGQPIQQINSVVELAMSVVDLENLHQVAADKQVDFLATQEAQRPFNLEFGPLLRVTVVRLSSLEHVVLFTMHHIISDGWSTAILVQEVATLYEAFANGKPSPLPELPIQYADFAVWQREWLQGKVLEAQKSYWQQQLGDAPLGLDFPTDHPRQAIPTYIGATQSFVLSKSLSESLSCLANSEGVTLFMTLLTGFKILLHRYTHQDDIVVGTPIANRNRSQIEGLIGFFVNTLVLRTKLAGNPSVRQLLKRVREMTLGAYTHQDLPFEQLVEELQPERHLNRNPLFDVMFAFQNALEQELELPGLTLSPLLEQTKTAIFDLSLSMSETEQGLEGSIEYSTDLFEASTIERMVGHFQVLLEGIVANLDQKLSELQLLSQAEQHLLVEWNATQIEYPEDKCIHELFELQVERTPNAIAVVFADQHLTYRELNNRANQLAHYLQKLGVAPEVLVGICVERSLEMIVGLLAILKAGGAYVPLDPAYPQERMGFILEDAQASVLLVQKTIAEAMPQHKAKVVCLDTDWLLIDQQSKENLFGEVTTHNLAYVIYTSGSTGRPKGVMIEHHSAIAMLDWSQKIFAAQAREGVLASTSICFDLSMFEMFVPLSCGSKVILVANALCLSTLPLAQSVTLINTVPSVIAELLRTDAIPASVNTINIAGEPLHNKLVQQLYQLDNIKQVFNLYGPSEDTTYSTFTCIQKGFNKIPPIGKPIANTQIYLLDQDLQSVPVGVPGELYISGAGLARGYLNQPELTATKFIPNTFSDQFGTRLYKTGDLARYLPNGDIEYIGRIDHQVKLRGFRIELGEIEAALNQHPSVGTSLVILREKIPDHKHLVAYMVSEEAQKLEVKQVRSFLKQQLPEYMIPSAFVELETLPLTPNGKIDRQALPAPDSTRFELEKTFVAPRELLELQLTQIWEDLLNIRPISVIDNFFDLGGHSLLAVRLILRIKQQLKQQLPLSVLFQAGTIEHLAGVLRQQHEFSLESPLVPIQPGGSKQPFFCVRPSSGNVFCYYHLAHCLNADRPFYGLEELAPILEGKREPFSRIEDMASEFIGALRLVQPEGPYFLGGWSMGGMVAFEMATQLQKQGEKVALLALLDTAVPIKQKNLHKENINDVKILADIARATAHFSGKNLFFSEEKLQELESEEQLNYILEQMKMASFLAPDIGLDMVRRFIKVCRNDEKAFSNYHPQFYPDRITLFRSDRTQDIAQGLYDSWLGWDKFSSQPVEVHVVPGDHHTMFSPPNVQTLAEQLRTCLERI